MLDLETQLNEVQAQALARLAAAKTENEIEELRVQVLGRKGDISLAMKALRNAPPEQRPELGKIANQVKERLSKAIQNRIREIQDAALADAVAGIDVTLPGRRRHVGAAHPLTRTMNECVQVFRRLGFVVADGPDIEDEYHNFDALNTPADHPSRDLQDTFYLPDGRLLRTHTSPVQIRVMESQKPPIRIIAPGRCYRRDTPDATHTVNFNQIEGLSIDRDVTMADLKSTLLIFARELFGKDAKIRMRPHFFPFTEPSIECDFTCVACGGKGCGVCKDSGWLEIAGAGMVDPSVLNTVGIDSEVYTGFAFGMGIERIAMLRYGITDIRLLYENDIRFLQQF